MPVILIYGAIFWMSDQPKLPGPESYTQRFVWFKFWHLLVYASLAWFMFQAWRKSLPKASLKKIVMISLVSTLFLAATDEWHQSFVIGREGTFRDIGIDLLGIGSALWLQRRYNQTRLVFKSSVAGKLVKPQSGM